MKPSLSFDEVFESGRPPLLEMQRMASALDESKSETARAALTRQVLLVEASVRQTYGQAARLARKAEALEDVVDVWNEISRFCDAALQITAGLKNKYPQCGTPQLYDLILDYKLAADKRHQGAMEEIACHKMESPAGLFPNVN